MSKISLDKKRETRDCETLDLSRVSLLHSSQ